MCKNKSARLENWSDIRMKENEWLKIAPRLQICTSTLLEITVSETRGADTLEGFAG